MATNYHYVHEKEKERKKSHHILYSHCTMSVWGQKCLGVKHDSLCSKSFGLSHKQGWTMTLMILIIGPLKCRMHLIMRWLWVRWLVQKPYFMNPNCFCRFEIYYTDTKCEPILHFTEVGLWTSPLISTSGSILLQKGRIVSWWLIKSGNSTILKAHIPLDVVYWFVFTKMCSPRSLLCTSTTVQTC